MSLGPALRRCAGITVAVLVLGGCTSGEDAEPPASDDGDRSGGVRSTATAPAPDLVLQELRRMSPVPDVRRPAALAGRLRLLGSVLADPDARPAAVRRAAELEQVATRTLGQAPPARAQAVLPRLPDDLRRTIAADVGAARSLSALAEPQSQLPRWRVVTPPPRERLLRAYRAAERRTGAPWEHLAAIHLVETRMGRIRGVSSAGAQGPMQFLPSTWDIYGAGGDITDVEDAVMAAGRLLRANGAPRDLSGALFAYNQSDSYVDAVQAYAANMRRAPQAYRGYWHWRVLYRHTRGTLVLPVGFPRRPAVPLGRS